jgi:outer membrane lipopolysaccharide assembly protein LptE/RlpB
MRKQLAQTAVCLMLSAGCLSACGYRLTVGAGRLPDGSQQLFIPVADNRSMETTAGVFFTEALRREASRRGLALVEPNDEKPSTSVPVLEARVESISSAPRGVTMAGDRFIAREEEVVVEVLLRVALNNGSVFQRTLRQQESFLVAPDLRGTEVNRELAWRRALDRLARQGMEALARRF